MNTSTLLEDFLSEIQETLESEGVILVGHFVWILRGMERGLNTSEMLQLSGEAYSVVRQRYDVQLMWTDWPMNLDTARSADDSTPLGFDLDPDGSLVEPLLCLVLQV
ncbi:hypothetical protein [Nocardioides sp.]|uniref:hypothetical protein n=1 Tax=Nocardioides sp. TaxID=35761 RepID=UPI002726CE8B|nr:hypothetical protein [Nocardioides sp.]MDO9456589.1 hypothetical protein [Nocardioides sp.]